jgi:hypothetical protein
MRNGSAAAAGQHCVQHVVTADKMVEKRGGRVQGNKRHKEIGAKLVRCHRLFGEYLVGANHRW